MITEAHPTGRPRPAVCVFAPYLYVTVTVESDDDGHDEIHIHAGGQGFWIARMVRALGGDAVLCGPLGGETGNVVCLLAPEAGVELAAVEVSGSTPAYVHDRRSGERRTVAQSALPPLDRHELDDLYTAMLERALSADVCVVSGRVDDGMPSTLYERLGRDLANHDIPAVGDLHADELTAFLDGGPLAVLKMSDVQLAEDAGIESGDDRSVVQAMQRLVDRGARRVVVSRAEMPALALFGDRTLAARPPRLERVDSSGAGDSMTAALAVGLARGLDPESMLRLACAAGAANVTRHGLGSASSELIEELIPRVDIVLVERVAG